MLNCIKETQEKIQSTIVDEDFYTEEFGDNCRKKFSAEPKEFMERGYGCCVQYSRLIEKSLNYYNFETRHIFLISPYKDISLSNFLSLGQQSHAVTEVLTSKGWMGIDSILTVIVAINENGKFKVYKYADIINNKKSKEIFPNNDFYHQNLDLIYGLYSRHGYFYGPNLPGPEFNLREILYNF